MIWQQLFNALMLGSTYALLAIGYTLVFGILNMLNFTHPTIFALGGFLIFAAVATLHLPFLAAVVAVAIVSGAIGFATELFCFRPAVGRNDELAPAISSIAFGLVLTEVITKVWGSEPVKLPAILNATPFTIGDFRVSSVQLLILGVSLALVVAIDLMLQRTRAGYALRAVAEQRQLAQLLGVNVKMTVVLSFVVSGVLAGLAGMLLALRLGLADPNVGLSFGLRALAVMVIGGLGNVRGAMLGGLLVGLVDVLTLAFLSQSYSGAGAWILLFVVLLIKPTGILGTRLQRETI